MSNDKDKYNIMIERSNKILKLLLIAKEPVGISEISKQLQIPKVTVFRILNTLAKDSFIKKDIETDKYTLGISFIEYGENVKSRLNIKNITKPWMSQLSKKIHETVSLALNYDMHSLYVNRIEGDSSIYTNNLKHLQDLYCSAAGKLFLSNMSDEKIREYFKNQECRQSTIYTITSYNEFMQEREMILKNNIAYDNEECEYGLMCIAKPIADINGQIRSAISVSGPKSRLKSKNINYIIDELTKCCDEINKEICASKLESIL